MVHVPVEEFYPGGDERMTFLLKIVEVGLDKNLIPVSSSKYCNSFPSFVSVENNSNLKQKINTS